MKSWVMTTRAARAASSSLLLSAGVLVGVVPEALRVAGANVCQHDPGRTSREALERGLRRANLLARRMERAQAQQHRVHLRHQLERVRNRQQGSAVEDNELVDVADLLEELPEAR